MGSLGGRKRVQRDGEPAGHQNDEHHKVEKLADHSRQRKQDDVPLEHRDGQSREQNARPERERLQAGGGHLLVVRREPPHAEGEVGEEIDEEDTVKQVERTSSVGCPAVFAQGDGLVQGEAEAKDNEGSLDKVDPVNLVVELDEHEQDQNCGESEMLDSTANARNAQEVVVEPGMLARFPVVHFNNRAGLETVIEQSAARTSGV